MTNETTENNTEASIPNFTPQDVMRLLEAIEIAYSRGTYSQIEVDNIQHSFDSAKIFLAQFTAQEESNETTEESTKEE